MLAERAARVLSAEAATGLQDGNDVLGERRQLTGKGRAHDREAVDGSGVLPGDHVVGELLRGARELILGRALA